MEQDNLPDEILRLQEKVASHPDSLNDVWALADAYAEYGHWEEALKVYKVAITLDPTNADLHNELGTIYEELDNVEQGEKAYW